MAKMHILLPTDFSKASIIPVYYAAKLARKINAKIILFHAVYMNAIPRASTSFKPGLLINAMSENALADLEALAAKLKDEVGNDIEVNCHVGAGMSLKAAIEAYTNKNKIDLIIMGTKGASGLKKVLMGSNTTDVIASSKIPVITVPELAYFSNIHKIVYASDFLDVEQELEALLPFAQLFQASIHILHIVSPEFTEEIDTGILLDDLLEKHAYPEISVHTKVSSEVINAIDEYIKESDANILAMFTHKPTFFEKLFGQSITREMAFHSNVTLLTLKKAPLDG